MRLFVPLAGNTSAPFAGRGDVLVPAAEVPTEHALYHFACPCGLHGDSECHWTMAHWHRARARGQLNKTNQKSTPQGSKGWGWIEKKRKKDKKEKEHEGMRCEEWQTEHMLSSCWWQSCWFHRWMCSSREKISHSLKMCISKASLFKMDLFIYLFFLLYF